MTKTSLLTLLLVVAAVFGLRAQVTTEPSPLQEDAKDVTVFFHADQGNKRLAGQHPTAKIYAHTGVILEGNGDWVNAPKWGDNSEKYELTYVSENLWKLYIGDIRTYYGITDPAAKIDRLAFVFRNSACTLEGKTASNGDIFVDLVDAGLQISLESDAGGRLISASNAKVTFKAGTTMAADITLTVNGEEIAKATNSNLLTAEYTFPGPGDYKVKATAKSGSSTTETDDVYCYAPASQPASYPGGGEPVMGPVRNSDGSVTFCLGAPGKQSAMIIGEWNDYDPGVEYVMNYTDVGDQRYFWVTVAGLENDEDYGYYFIVDGSLKVGDPYARLVLDPYNDKYISPAVFPDLPEYPDEVEGVPVAIYRGDINDYDWQVKDFKGVAQTDLIIYEMLLRDFTGTEGAADGNGTVRLAMEKIPYLKKLGVSAIELLPINEFAGNNSWGYNPNFYFAPDKAYGTPDDYKAFIDLCHQNGIAVILDMVFNQSDGMHPWYVMYEPGSNPFYNKTAPHAYSVLNDWNQGYAMVQEQWHDVLRYWLKEYNVDGFRFDLVKGLGDNNSYTSPSDADTNAYNQSRIDRMKKLKEVVDAARPGAYFINENLATAREENAMAESGELNWANVNNAGCQFAMGYQSESDMNRLYAPKDGGRLWGSTVSYLESHDEQRLAYKQDMWGVAGVKGNVKASMQRLGSAAAQMILSPGAHMIWQFSELGNAQTTKNDDGSNNTSPKIVDWALFDDPDHRGLYENYAELISIRNDNPELFAESASFEISCGQSNWAAGRTLASVAGDKELYTAVNPNVDKEITVAINFLKGEESAYRVMSKSYGSQPKVDVSSKTVTVPANCYVVVGSSSVAAVDGISSDDAAPFRAYARDGRIFVEDASVTVSVYGADGRMSGVVENGAGSLSVMPGVYILSGAGKTVKVLVR